MLDISTLRRPRCYRVVRGALADGCRRPGFRVVEFSVQSNHIHLICEASDRRALARGLQGLFVRIARRLNRELDRKGTVFADRYHDVVLATPTQVRNALAYVLNNARRHAARRGWSYGSGWVDPCSSGVDFGGWSGRYRVVKRISVEAPLPRARTWLLSEGWRRAGPVRVNEVPGSSAPPMRRGVSPRESASSS